MPLESPFAPVDIPLIDLWTLHCEHDKRPYPDEHKLLIDGETDLSYTFSQLRDASIRFGRGLAHVFNWRKGDTLGFFSPNDVDTPVVNFGNLWAGGISSPANPTFTVDELARQLADSKAKALVTQKPFLQAACAAADKVGLPRDRIILMGRERDDKFRHWLDITADGAWFKPKKPVVKPEDAAYLVYSSGTTGLPKGVKLTHYNMVANSLQARRFDIKGLNWDSDAQLGVLPFFHIYGLSVVLNATFASGAPCIVMPKWDIEKACAWIQKHRITFAYTPPPIVLALSKHPVVDKYDLSSMRWINCAAAPLSKELVESCWKRLALGVKQGYGLSETSPSISSQLQDEWWRFQGAVGRLYPNMSAKIVDPDGNEVATGESGELLVKGPNIFSGYWNRPDLQEETFTKDGWYKTGDVFHVDKHGNYYITDRIKELIKYKGFQVPPAELEAKLIGREDIADVCVIGVWDKEQQTEVPRAYVALKEGTQPSDELAKDIIEWTAARVSPPKRLRGGVRFTKEIPKSASGKILRRLLRDQVRKEEEGPKAKL